MSQWGRTKSCENCGKDMRYKRGDAKFCNATCRKQAERKRKSHERELQKVSRWLEMLEEKDLWKLADIISHRLENL